MALLIGGLFLCVPFSGYAATYSVTRNDDPAPGACNPGDCSLREAITAANGNPGLDTVDFAGVAVAGSQVTITVDGDGQGQLPNVNEDLILTAENEWDTINDRPGIRITKTGTCLNGLYFNDAADNSRISGLKVEGFDDNGIFFRAEDSQIGLDCFGTPDSHQRNVIVGNNIVGAISSGNGIYMLVADRNHVAGNWFALDDNGTTWNSNNGASLRYYNSDENITGFDDDPAFSCTAAQARNIFAAGDDQNTDSLFIGWSSQENKVSGNYFNIRPDGSAIVHYGELAFGVYLYTDAKYNTIGTDGDGVDDSSEGNVGAGYDYGTFFGFDQDTNPGFHHNRVSGNIIGGDPTGTSDIYTPAPGQTEQGVRFIYNHYSNIIGYCDDTDDLGWAVNMCSNAGLLADQRNYFIGNTGISDSHPADDGSGMLFSHIVGDDSMIYGNYFGIGKDDSSIPNYMGINIIAGEAGGNDYFGAAGNRTNSIKNNTYGVVMRMVYSSSGFPGAGYIIQNNDISNNSSHGIFAQDYNLDQTPGEEPIVRDNTISGNGGSGVFLEGSTMTLESNTLTGNADYGIYAAGTLDHALNQDDLPNHYDPYYDKQTPIGHSYDLVSKPDIGGSGVENTINSNTDGGILFVDTRAANETTLLTDNNIGNNNNNFDIRSTWWGAVEILYKDLNPIKSGSNTVSVIPQSGATYSGSTLSNGTFTNPPYPAGDTDQGAWGPASFEYDDEPTWFYITDYEYDVNGSKTEYGPFTIKVYGDYANDSLNPTFTFNGKDDDTNPGGLPSYYDTDGVWRYQIADAIVSTVPDQPANTSPANGSVDQKTDVALSASAFADAAETHAASQWKVYNSSSQCAADSGAVLNTGDAAANTSYTVPYGSLAKGATYWWHVRYKNSYGNYSNYSNCTVFTTSTSNIIQTGTIPNQQWNEDTTLTKAFDLDDYFQDLRSLAMHYEVLGSDSPANITVSIGSENKVTFTPKSNWYGTATVTFKAIDTEGDTRNSNQVTLTVNNVNDPPNKITSGFSPPNNSTTSSQTPTLKWDAPSDPDHSKSQLYYRVRIGKNSDPANNYEYSYTSATGSPEVNVINQLNDETDYYWTVRAIDPEGLKGEWSGAKKFYVNTSLDPEISLTKIVTVGTAPLTWLNKFIKMAMAATGNENVEFRELDYSAYQIPLWSFLFIFLTLFLVTLFLSGGLKKPHLVIFRSPARSFSKIAPANKKGTWQMSYDQFRGNAKTNHWAAVGAGVITAALVVFAIFSPVIKAADDNGVPVEPGNYLKYSLTYRNTGDGDATSINIRDYIPSGTYLSSYGGDLNVNGTTLDFSDTAIAPGETKSVYFVVRVINPNFNSAVVGSEAAFSSNEASAATNSNMTSNPIETSTLSYYVQDPIGDPLPGSYVYIYKDGYKVSSGVTNENGELTFYGLGSGVYYAEVFGPSSFAATATAYTSVSRHSSAGQTIVLAFEEEEEEEFIIVIVNEEEIKIPRDIRPPQTEEERQELKETMENFLKLLMVNDTNVEGMDFFEATYGDVPGIEEYIDEEGNIQTLINVSGPELVLKGLTLPHATVTVKIRSEEVVRVTKADEYGRWEIRVPMELLPEGEHTVYAQSELYGVETDEIVLGKFVIPEEGQGLSKTMWLFIVNLSLIVAFAIFMFFYTRKRGLTFKKKV